MVLIFQKSGFLLIFTEGVFGPEMLAIQTHNMLKTGGKPYLETRLQD